MWSKMLTWFVGGVLALMFIAGPLYGELEFGIPTPVPSPINDDGAYLYPWLPNDELTMFYATTGAEAAGVTDLAFSTRSSIDDAWSSPVNLGGPINTDDSETWPSLTEDGLELYFARTSEPFSAFDADVYVSKRTSDDAPWGPPEVLNFNSDGRDSAPRISSDGLKLYFDSTRPQSETPLSLSTWVATRPSRDVPFGEPEFFFGGFGYVTDDGLKHIFSSGPVTAAYYGAPNYGGDDIYIRTRESTTEDFGPVTNLGTPVNSSGLGDCCADFGILDSTFYFTSTRPGGPDSGLFGFINIWQAPIAESVPVDIKPGSDVAPINLKSKGKLPVAILSTDEFDATQVDAETLLFGDPLLIADGQTPVSPLRWAYEYVNDDDLLDLTLKFSMRDIVGNGVMGPMTVEGYLAGQTFDGLEIAGREIVRIVPAKVFDSTTFTVPEPTSLALVLVGLIGVLALRR